MQLNRPRPQQRLISLVSMIDVLLIMLVFFMVTSTYLNLDMIPMAQSDDTPAPQINANNSEATAPVMIRLASDGQPYLRGRIVTLDDLSALMTTRLMDAPNTRVLVLPAARATTQSLVSLMDTLTAAGITNMRIVQLEAVN